MRPLYITHSYYEVSEMTYNVWSGTLNSTIVLYPHYEGSDNPICKAELLWHTGATEARCPS